MPLLLLTTGLGYILGRKLRTAAMAYALTACAAAISTFTVIWAVADGNGNDPAWLIAVAAAFGALAMALTRLGVSHRQVAA